MHSSFDNIPLLSDNVGLQPQLEEQYQLQQLLLCLQEYDTTNPDISQNVIPLPQARANEELSSHKVKPCEREAIKEDKPKPGMSTARNPESGERNKRRSTQIAHNLSEKMRREKFKNKIKTLQQLLPRCHKNDTSSVLDETIKQMQLLKLQLQWLKEQYAPSTMNVISPSNMYTTLAPPMIQSQWVNHSTTNVVGMISYPAMLQYDVAASRPSTCQMIPATETMPSFPPRQLFSNFGPA